MIHNLQVVRASIGQMNPFQLLSIVFEGFLAYVVEVVLLFDMRFDGWSRAAGNIITVTSLIVRVVDHIVCYSG